jgi:hypothetical protein
MALADDDRRSNMKLDDATFRQLRRLAPILDDILNAGEIEHADQAVNLASLAQLCSRLFDAYHDQHPCEIAQAQLDAVESQSAPSAHPDLPVNRAPIAAQQTRARKKITSA